MQDLIVELLDGIWMKLADDEWNSARKVLYLLGNLKIVTIGEKLI